VNRSSCIAQRGYTQALDIKPAQALPRAFPAGLHDGCSIFVFFCPGDRNHRLFSRVLSRICPRKILATSPKKAFQEEDA
jgi:hypothetical protein